MQEPTQPTTETVTLHSAGPIAGIPGNSHAPGTYLVDWIERTIKRVEDAAEAVIEHVEEAVHPTPEPEAPVEPAPTPETPAEPPASEPVQEAAQSSPTGEAAPVEEAQAN